MSENQETFLLQNKVNLRFYEQDPLYILQMEVLAQARQRTCSVTCQEKKTALKKGSTDCPLQNDYCIYSCITMF